MAEQMIDEIYELCKRVQNETNVFVQLQTYAYSRGELMATVSVSENGFHPCGEYGFVYFIDGNSEINMFDECKAHLERLLKDGIVEC